MNNKKNWIGITGFIIANLVIIIFYKIIFFLDLISDKSTIELKSIYPRFSDVVFLFTRKVTLLYVVWFILLLLVNTFFSYLLAKHFNKLKEIILTLITLSCTFIIVELTLRMLNYKPGTHTYVRYFTPVDSLFMLKGFDADSNGIFKVSDRAIIEIKQNIKSRDFLPASKKSTPRIELHNDRVIEIYSLVQESLELMDGKTNNEFSTVYHSLLTKDSSHLSEQEKAILQFVHCPINEDGFRSIAFKQYTTDKPVILLLGDSFTWGHSASAKSNSFSDILLARGYIVYNTGISGADVAQYLAVAKKYLPILKPDIVIANFYLGNDITYYKRDPEPYAPLFFSTNAGNLMSCLNGKYFKNPQSAYKGYLNQWQIPENKSIFNRIMAKTVITTLTWRLLLKLNFVDYGYSETDKYYNEALIRKYNYPYCNKELEQIKEITKQNNARFILSCLPEVYTFTFNTKKDFPDLFNGLDYIEMSATRNDYNTTDGHFNNKGHSRYADFLIQQIETDE